MREQDAIKNVISQGLESKHSLEEKLFLLLPKEHHE